MVKIKIEDVESNVTLDSSSDLLGSQKIYLAATSRIRALLKKKHSIDEMNNKSQTALFFAVATNSPPIVLAFLDTGANYDLLDSELNNILHFVCYNLDYEVHKLVWKYINSPQEKCLQMNFHHRTPLQKACLHCNTQLIKHMIDRIPKSILISHFDDAKSSLLHMVSINHRMLSSRRATTELLLSVGFDPFLQNAKGYTPFYYFTFPSISLDIWKTIKGHMDDAALYKGLNGPNNGKGESIMFIAARWSKRSPQYLQALLEFSTPVAPGLVNLIWWALINPTVFYLSPMLVNNALHATIEELDFKGRSILHRVVAIKADYKLLQGLKDKLTSLEIDHIQHEIWQTLIEYKHNHHFEFPKFSHDNVSPLFMAAMWNNHLAIHYLCSFWHDPESICNQNQQNAMHIAATHGSLETLSYLATIANWNLDKLDKDNRNVAFVAAYSRQEKTLIYLLENHLSGLLEFNLFQRDLGGETMYSYTKEMALWNQNQFKSIQLQYQEISTQLLAEEPPSVLIERDIDSSPPHSYSPPSFNLQESESIFENWEGGDHDVIWSERLIINGINSFHERSLNQVSNLPPNDHDRESNIYDKSSSPIGHMDLLKRGINQGHQLLGTMTMDQDKLPPTNIDNPIYFNRDSIASSLEHYLSEMNNDQDGLIGEDRIACQIDLSEIDETITSTLPTPPSSPLMAGSYIASLATSDGNTIYQGTGIVSPLLIIADEHPHGSYPQQYFSMDAEGNNTSSQSHDHLTYDDDSDSSSLNKKNGIEESLLDHHQEDADDQDPSPERCPSTVHITSHPLGSCYLDDPIIDSVHEDFIHSDTAIDSHQQASGHYLVEENNPIILVQLEDTLDNEFLLNEPEHSSHISTLHNLADNATSNEIQEMDIGGYSGSTVPVVDLVFSNQSSFNDDYMIKTSPSFIHGDPDAPITTGTISVHCGNSGSHQCQDNNLSMSCNNIFIDDGPWNSFTNLSDFLSYSQMQSDLSTMTPGSSFDVKSNRNETSNVESQQDENETGIGPSDTILDRSINLLNAKNDGISRPYPFLQLSSESSIPFLPYHLSSDVISPFLASSDFKGSLGDHNSPSCRVADSSNLTWTDNLTAPDHKTTTHGKSSPIFGSDNYLRDIDFSPLVIDHHIIKEIPISSHAFGRSNSQSPVLEACCDDQHLDWPLDDGKMVVNGNDMDTSNGPCSNVDLSTLVDTLERSKTLIHQLIDTSNIYLEEIEIILERRRKLNYPLSKILSAEIEETNRLNESIKAQIVQTRSDIILYGQYNQELKAELLKLTKSIRHQIRMPQVIKDYSWVDDGDNISFSIMTKSRRLPAEYVYQSKASSWKFRTVMFMSIILLIAVTVGYLSTLFSPTLGQYKIS